MALWDTFNHCNSLRKNTQVANSQTVLNFFDKSIKRDGQNCVSSRVVFVSSVVVMATVALKPKSETEVVTR